MKDKLFMVLLGCKPEGRLTEQHDIFFGIAPSLELLVDEMKDFWKQAGKIHIDVWREVTMVEEHSINISSKTTEALEAADQPKLFFINLGGYKKDEFEEYHHKILLVSNDKSAAIKQAKQTMFYRGNGSIKGAPAHIDDQYGFDVDDIYQVEDILSPGLKRKYQIDINAAPGAAEDFYHIGYLPLSKLNRKV